MEKNEALFRYTIERFLGLNSDNSNQLSLKPGESSFMKNFRITDNFALKKRNGYRLLHDFNLPVRSILLSDINGNELFMALGNQIIKTELPFNGTVTTVGSVDDSENCFFMQFHRKIYLWGGGKIQVYDSDTQKFSDIEPYIPLVAINCDPLTGAGTPFEGVNMITRTMRKRFLIDRAQTGMRLDGGKKFEKVDWLKFNGEILDKKVYDFDIYRTFVYVDDDILPMDTKSEIEVQYTIKESQETIDNYNKIAKLSHYMFYGGENDTKIFLWGNPDYPDTRFWSGTADGLSSATFFPEDSFTRIGDGSKICDIIRQYDRQLIFCEKAAYLSYIEAKTDQLGRNYFSFPVRTISDTKGSAICGQSKLVGNLPVTLMRDGLYKWISTTQRDERNTVKFSNRIDDLLRKEDISQAKMYDCEFSCELYIYFPNGNVYIYNYNSDVFYFYDNIFAFDFCTDSSGNIYFCSNDGKLYMFDDIPDDDGKAIDCQWQSGYLDMNYEGLKNLYHVGIAYQPALHTAFDIGYICDSDTQWQSSSANIPLSGRSETAHIGKNLKHRMRTKRFNHIKFQIKNQLPNTKTHLYRISLHGRYTNT